MRREATTLRFFVCCWCLAVVFENIQSTNSFTVTTPKNDPSKVRAHHSRPWRFMAESSTSMSANTSRKLRKSKNYPSQTYTWEQRYEQLKEFHRIHGHTAAPRQEDPDWIGLRQFVQRQRKQYNKWKKGEETFLTADKIELLNEIDFLWDMHEAQWLERLQDLADFRNEFGHCNVQMKYATLGQWCTKQRREYNNGEMTQSRIDSLNELGFIWDVAETQFQEGLRQLQEFKMENNGQWPKVTEGSIGSWFYSRRREYLHWLRGGNSTLTESHRLALEDIGFDASLKRRRKSRRVDSEWEERLEELMEFKMKYGHTRVARGYGRLGTWVNAQRYKLGPHVFEPDDKVGATSLERIQRLNEIDFVWNTHTWLWDKRLEALTIYHKENGHTNVPKSIGALGQWCERQRVEFSKYQRNIRSNLTAQRVSRLNALGFDWDRGDTKQIEWDLQWYRKLALLKGYFAKHGDFDVPRDHPTLGNWVFKQKSFYKGMLRGVKNSLSEQRRLELDAIGFF